MRKILFRGKRTNNDNPNLNGKWVEGFYVYRGEECNGPDSFKHFIVTHDIYGFSWYEVDPKTVGQCVGRADANEKEMFEDDIVKHDGKIYRIAYWHTSFWLWKGGLSCVDHIPIGENDYYALEVIGNIHDNPELLEQAEAEYFKEYIGE